MTVVNFSTPIVMQKMPRLGLKEIVFASVPALEKILESEREIFVCRGECESDERVGMEAFHCLLFTSLQDKPWPMVYRENTEQYEMGLCVGITYIHAYLVSVSKIPKTVHFTFYHEERIKNINII